MYSVENLSEAIGGNYHPKCIYVWYITEGLYNFKRASLDRITDSSEPTSGNPQTSLKLPSVDLRCSWNYPKISSDSSETTSGLPQNVTTYELTQEMSEVTALPPKNQWTFNWLSVDKSRKYQRTFVFTPTKNWPPIFYILPVGRKYIGCRLLVYRMSD